MKNPSPVLHSEFCLSALSLAVSKGLTMTTPPPTIDRHRRCASRESNAAPLLEGERMDDDDVPPRCTEGRAPDKPGLSASAERSPARTKPQHLLRLFPRHALEPLQKLIDRRATLDVFK